MTKFDTIYKRLKDYLDRIPIKQAFNFKIEAINNGDISIFGLRNDELIKMDQVDIGNSVETRWTIQDKAIQFVILKGNVNLHFRLNENIHIKPLSVTQSIRIPSGIPFMLKTFEKECSILLMSALEVTNG